MTTPLFTRCSAAIRAVEALSHGCDVSDWDAHQLVVVPRRRDTPFPEYAALVSSFGTGAVVSVAGEHVEFVRAIAPEKHYRVFSPSFLGRLAAEIGRTGRACEIGQPNLCFVPSQEPPLPDVPDAYSLREMRRGWIDEWAPRREFHNALGEEDDDDWTARLVAAFVAFEGDEPAAVAGVADDGNGCFEIGLDVRRRSRGRGLARPVVLAATRGILDRGGIPYYTCDMANVLSHHVAESCGYRPLWTVAAIEYEEDDE